MRPPELITVVETGPYLAVASVIMSATERAEIVNRIAREPSAGDLIPGAGGLRKVRIPLQGRGKRGGGRVITFFHDLDMPVFLIAVYAKNELSDLTHSQRQRAAAIADGIRAQYGR
jgi:hypothetical protein